VKRYRIELRGNEFREVEADSYEHAYRVAKALYRYVVSVTEVPDLAEVQ
jgi:hypothetical protein